MQKWMELTLSTPSQLIGNPRHFRELLACASDNAAESEKINPAIFHYQDEKDAKPLNSMPTVRFGQKGLYPQLYAIGNESIKLLNEEAPKIIDAFEKHFKTSVTENRITRLFTVPLLSRLASYRIPLMVLQGNKRHHNKFINIKDEGITEKHLDFITRKISAGIERQIHFIDPLFDLDDFIVGDCKVNGDILPIKGKPGLYFLAAKDVEFRCNILLEGPWHVGHLISKGHGRVYPARKGRSHERA